jgi:hypothetical protein
VVPADVRERSGHSRSRVLAEWKATIIYRPLGSRP